MIGSYSLRGVCAICNTPGHACGDSHMRRGPVDNVVDERTVMPEPQELREYVYVVNNQLTTAMLTPKMAERLGARPVGEGEPRALFGGYTNEQNQAVYSASDMSGGVTGEGSTDPVVPQQKGLTDDGRTRSMLAPQEAGRVPNAEPGDREGGGEVLMSKTEKEQAQARTEGRDTTEVKSGDEPQNKARRATRDK